MKHFIILIACLQYSMTLHQKEWPTQHESLNPRCPDGWLDGGHLGCYLFLYQETSLSWMEAQEVCEQHGGFLAEVKDEEQQNFIESFAIIEESLTGVTSWWLGLTDSGHEGRWVWSHSVSDASFTSWSPGHPNSSPDNQDDCVSISLEDHFHWKDVPCFNQSHTSPSPICHRVIHPQTTTQQPASTDPTTTTISTPTPTNSTTTFESSTTTTSTGSTGFLLLGGWNNLIGNDFLDNVEVYSSDLSLPSLPSLPLPLYEPIAEMTESGAVYVAGGHIDYNSYNDKTFMLSSLSSSVWEEVEARMPRPVYRSTSVGVRNIVLVLGGYTRVGSGASGSDTIQLLNTNKSLPTWSLLKQSKLPEPMKLHSAAVHETQVIIVNEYGVTFTTSVSSIISDTELNWVRGELPGVGRIWPTSSSTTTTPRSYYTTPSSDYTTKPGDGVNGPSIEVCDGKLVVVYASKVFTKTTMDSQWVQLKPLPRWKQWYPSIGSVQGNIVVGGGLDGDGASARVFMWLEVSSEWEEVNSLKIPRSNHATVQLP